MPEKKKFSDFDFDEIPFYAVGCEFWGAKKMTVMKIAVHHGFGIWGFARNFQVISPAFLTILDKTHIQNFEKYLDSKIFNLQLLLPSSHTGPFCRKADSHMEKK